MSLAAVALTSWPQTLSFDKRGWLRPLRLLLGHTVTWAVDTGLKRALCTWSPRRGSDGSWPAVPQAKLQWFWPDNTKPGEVICQWNGKKRGLLPSPAPPVPGRGGERPAVGRGFGLSSASASEVQLPSWVRSSHTPRRRARPWVQILALLPFIAVKLWASHLPSLCLGFPVSDRVVMKIKYISVRCSGNTSVKRHGRGHQGRVYQGVSPGLEGCPCLPALPWGHLYAPHPPNHPQFTLVQLHCFGGKLLPPATIKRIPGKDSDWPAAVGGHSQPSPVVMGRASSSHSDHLFRQREVPEKKGGGQAGYLQWERLPVR